MNTGELSDFFDLLSNAYQRPGGKFETTDTLAFDEYEKSVYLTMAQNLFVISCYNGRNDSGYQFEITEEDRRILDSLVVTVHPISFEFPEQLDVNIVDESVFYKLPSNLLFVTYESVTFQSSDKCINGKTAIVQPVTQDEFWKTYNNPFRGPNDRRVLRLDMKNNIVELVSKHKIGDYLIRFLKKPNPIILVDIPSSDDLTLFDGNTVQQECELDSQVHEKIVEIAVNMALQRKSIGNSK